MIVKKINLDMFIKEFERFNRDGHFTMYGLEKIYNHLEELSEDTGEPIELDVIAICCDFVEYNSISDVMCDYPNIEDVDDLEYYTHVICAEDNCIIFYNF